MAVTSPKSRSLLGLVSPRSRLGARAGLASGWALPADNEACWLPDSRDTAEGAA